MLRLRRTAPLLCLVPVLAFGVARAHAGGPATVRDELTTVDPAGWTVGDHLLGRGDVSPADVRAEGGRLRLALPPGTFDGGELRSRRAFGDGTFRARLRVPNVPRTLTALFLYRAPDLQAEIDVEILDRPDGRALLTTYAGGRATHALRVRLGFDPTAGFHTYGFERTPDAIRFEVDGRPLRTLRGALPSGPLHLYVNAWSPTWLPVDPVQPGGTALVDWIEHPAR